MYSCFLSPMEIYVFAKILHQFRHLVSARRLMSTPANLNARRAKIARVRADSIERYTVKM